ncbi:unnamed protein product, partial [Brassica oleracea var. botrytis]
REDRGEFLEIRVIEELGIIRIEKSHHRKNEDKSTWRHDSSMRVTSPKEHSLGNGRPLGRRN